MLTDSEKRWLQLRKLYEGANYYSYYSCMHCQFYNEGRWQGYKRPCNEACLYDGCPFIDIESEEAVYDYIDAARFEERVAAKLANPQWAVCWISDSCLEFGGSKDEPRGWWNCEWCRLKHARLQVEEDMDGR